MHVYIVFAHPTRDSFTGAVLESFLSGLEAAGHTHEVGDLYRMDFVCDMDVGQYRRERGDDPGAPVPEDVLREQEKIAGADALVFIYPVWWSDCPAKLKGWFDRVWTYGYAYTHEDGETRASRIGVDKALVICPAGHPALHLEEIGIAGAMRAVMIEDRLLGVGVSDAEMVILGGMVPGDDSIRKRNLETAFRLGKELEGPS